MKEAYFTPDTIIPVATGMMNDVTAGYQNRTAPPLEQAALLLLDMQRIFLEPVSHAFIPSAPAILPGLNSLVQVFTDTGRLVVFTRHVNTELNAGQMKHWWRDMIRPEDEMSQLYSGVKVPPDCPTVRKSQYDAFFNTDLESILAEKKIDTVLIAGVMTHLCCESTARAAFMRGFNVIFLADGTATYTAGHHRASLLNLSHGFANITTVQEILDRLDKK